MAAIGAAGQDLGLIDLVQKIDLGGDYYPNRIIAAKDGSIYVEGSYSETGSDNGSPEFAAVVHLTKNLKIDTTFSADHDGLAGFRISDGYHDTFDSDAALTPSGDIVLIGYGIHGAGMVKLDGASKATRVTYTQSAGKLVINGSSGDDHFLAKTEQGDDGPDRDPGYADLSLLIRLDDNGTLISADSLNFVPDYDTGAKPVFSQLVFNLNSGNDVFDGSQLAQKVYVSGGNGNDVIAIGTPYNTVAAPYSTVYGGAGDDSIIVNADYATVHGDTGNDVVAALQHSQVYGDDDNDNVYGGDYSLISGGNGTDGLGHNSPQHPATLNGGAGTDFASYIAGDTLIDVEYPHQV